VDRDAREGGKGGGRSEGPIFMALDPRLALLERPKALLEAVEPPIVLRVAFSEAPLEAP